MGDHSHTRRDRIIDVAGRIQVLRAELHRLEAELDALTGPITDEAARAINTAAANVERAALDIAIASGVPVQDGKVAPVAAGLQHAAVSLVPPTPPSKFFMTTDPATGKRVVQVTFSAGDGGQAVQMTANSLREAITLGSYGARVLRLLKDNPGVPFDARTLAKRLAMDVDVMRTTLSRLNRAGRIVRVNKGLYRSLEPGEMLTPEMMMGGDEPQSEETA